MKKRAKNATKDEIVSHMQDVGRTKVKRDFVREKFFPALCEATDSINDADVFLQSFSSMAMESFLNLMKEKKFGEFDLTSKLDKNSPKYEAIQKMVHLFDDMSMREAQDMIDGMKDEIRFFYKKEMQTRKLGDLKVNFYE